MNKSGNVEGFLFDTLENESVYSPGKKEGNFQEGTTKQMEC